MKIHMRTGFFLFGFLLATTGLQAVQQSTLAYQGLLADNTGTAVTGIRDISVALYNDPSAGSLLWQETHDNAAVSEGVFNLELGTVTPFGALDFTQRIYLQITIADADGGNPETLPDRIPLVAVPFAMSAQSVAGGIDDADADAGNELVNAISLNGSNLELVQSGGTLSLDLSPLTDDDDWTMNAATVHRDDPGRALLYGDNQIPYSDDQLIPIGGLSCNSKFFFRPTKAALGGGAIRSVSGSGQKAVWNDENIGDFSFCWGFECKASGESATVSGGNANYATGSESTIAGGMSNQASETYAAVGGGRGNLAVAYAATVGGGDQNSAENTGATVGGGAFCWVRADYGTIGGGGPSNPGNPTTSNNMVHDEYGTIGGGGGNKAGNNDGNPTSAAYATVSGGKDNQASGGYSSVSGGIGNGASGSYSTIGGGISNSVSQSSTTVGGGSSNQATNVQSTVGGGFANLASGHTSTVAGGYECRATGFNSVVGGGNRNQAGDWMSTVAGGENNNASGANSFVGGGGSNTATGNFATLPGGQSNQTVGKWSVVSGGASNLTSNPYSTIGGGYYNSASGDYACVAGGRNNMVFGMYGTISGGGPSDPDSPTTSHNIAYDNHCTIGGGGYNRAGNADASTETAPFVTIGGGWANVASGSFSCVGGGGLNAASGNAGTVAGGSLNSAIGIASTVGGGSTNAAVGENSVIPGGQECQTDGDNSFACGFRAGTDHQGAFVWADSTWRVDRFTSNRADQFKIKAAGGMYLVAGSTGPTRGYPAWRVDNDGTGSSLMAVAGSTVTLESFQNGDLYVSGSVAADNVASPSDRRLKHDIQTLTGVLGKLEKLRGIHFEFNDQERYPAGGRVGVVAQELQAAFPELVSETPDGYLAVDYASLSAVLLQAVKEQQHQIEQTEARLRDIEAKLGL